MAKKTNSASHKNETGAFPQEDAPRLWHEHEHMSGPAAVEAQKLVNIAGSVELAKQALDNAIEPTEGNSRDAFAQRLGFASILELFEASKPTTDAIGLSWYLTPDPSGRWLIWNERDLTVNNTYHTAEEAVEWIHRIETT